MTDQDWLDGILNPPKKERRFKGQQPIMSLAQDLLCADLWMLGFSGVEIACLTGFSMGTLGQKRMKHKLKRKDRKMEFRGKEELKAMLKKRGFKLSDLPFVNDPPTEQMEAIVKAWDKLPEGTNYEIANEAAMSLKYTPAQETIGQLYRIGRARMEHRKRIVRKKK